MRSRRAIGVLSVVLLLAAGAAVAVYLGSRRDVTTSSQAAYETYRQAVENERRFYHKEARAGFARALELDPEFAMAMLGLARFSDRGQAESLLRRAGRARSELNEREKLHLDLQWAGFKEDREGALKVAREIRKRYPDDFRATMHLARSELARGNSDSAIEIFSELLAVDPNNAEAYNQIGYYYAYRGDYEKAIANLKKYQFISPDQANPHDSLGEVLAYAGHYDEAIVNLEKALKIKPDFFPAYDHLGVAYEGKGEYAKAIESYSKAAELSVERDAKIGFLGKVFRVACISEDLAAAGAVSARIQGLPDERIEFVKPFLEAGRGLLEERPAEAERRLAEAKPKLYAEISKRVKTPGYKPYEPVWNLLMALAKAEQGKEAEAIALYEEMSNPPNGWQGFEQRLMVYEGRAHLAALLAKKGELDRAEKLLEENRKWNPNWAPTRQAEAAVARLRRERVLALGAGARSRAGGER